MSDQTIVRVLLERAAEQGDRTAYTFLAEGDGRGEDLTYAELDAGARAIAATIGERVRPGSRALLVYAPGFDYLRAFFGCLYAGVVAVPLYPPMLNRSAPLLSTFADDCDADLILTASDLASAGDTIFFEREPQLRDRHWLVTDVIPLAAGDGWRDPRLTLEDLAFIQYTSGSTSFPKGVTLAHANIVDNSRTLHEFVCQEADAVGVSWLPPYHDMGLIGAILQGTYAGFPLVMMSPLSFLQRPMRWLEAISRFRGTSTAAPNFAYDLLARRATEEEVARLDLSSLDIAINGAETVQRETIERFNATFAPAGLRAGVVRPCFGLAEGTLLVTGSPSRSPVKTAHIDPAALEAGRVAPTEDGGREITALGPPLGGARIAIVQPDSLVEVEPGNVGEVLVCTGAMARGYWGREEETVATFDVRPVGADPGSPGYLRTGDLGFMADGELHWVGRLKDLIVVAGRNLHPQDIELTVEGSHPAARKGCCVVFADADERVVAVLEIDTRKQAPVEEIADAARAAVSREHSVAIRRLVLVEPRELPKTSSGKKQRRATRDLLARGELKTLHESGGIRQAAPATPAASEIADWLAGRIASTLELDGGAALDRARPLVELGLTSVQAAELAADLGALLGRDVPATLVFDFPTIERLADHLGDGTAGERPAIRDRKPARAGATSERADGAAAEPIAIVGMACRLPGAPDLDAFHDLLRSGRDAISETPPDRWDVEELFDPDAEEPGTVRTRRGGWLPEIDLFDPSFFGISPREARGMDPQQRLLLEVAWEALDDGGHIGRGLSASETGVFVGIGGSDYQLRLGGRLGLIDAHTGTGNAHSIAANRLSFALDLRGPSLAVDTACSSSLVALHLACRSLEEGETSLAIAGGVSIVITPETTVAFSAARMLSPDGRCRPFDADANGYVRGEGCGVVVLKRLTDALEDGDRIRAVVRGTAVNQDGQTNGLTAPSGRAQQAVLRRALERGGVAPEELGYFEAHGTGTPLGDPVEAASIASVVGPRRGPHHRCLLGSAKGNIGHLETAAGIAGLAKLVLSLERGQIYPQAHFDELNPRIDFGDSPLSVPVAPASWDDSTGPRIGAVNSFGFGGTNAAAVVEEAPPRRPVPRRVERPQQLVLVSGRSADGLNAQAERYADAVAQLDPSELADACFTTHAARAHFGHRLAVVGATPEELSQRLRAAAGGELPAEAVTGTVRGSMRPRVAFLFTGQGSQYPRMARDLRRAEPVFRHAFEECSEVIDPYLDQPIAEVIDGGDPEALEQTRLAQPALFAVEYSLAALWRAWGIEPDLLLGHSLGEYVAACVGGSIDLEDAAMLVAERARLMQSLPEGGAMAAVLAGEARVSAAIADHRDRVSIAGVNGGDSVSIAGESGAVDDVLAALEAEGVRSRRLKVSHAFHSPLVEPILDELEELAAGFTYRESRVPIVRNLTGEATTDAFDAAYWRAHARQPVRFADCMDALVDEGTDLFLEVGPHPTLTAIARRSVGGIGLGWVPSLRRGADDVTTMLRGLGQLYTAGVEPSWSGFHGRHRRRVVGLPSYPFQRTRHWIDISDEHRERSAGGSGGGGEAAHPLLERALPAPHALLEGRLSARRPAYLSDHRVQGRAVLPATALIEMALAAAHAGGATGAVLRDIEFHKPLFLDDAPSRVQVAVHPGHGGRSEVRVHSAVAGDEAGGWILHASGVLSPSGASERSRPEPLEEVRARCPDAIEGEDLYLALAERGLEYGPTFRGLARVRRGAGEALGELEVPSELLDGLAGHHAHPAVLDACLHAVAAALAPSAGEDGTAGGPVLPVRLERIQVHAKMGSSLAAHARLRERSGRDGVGAGSILADVAVYGAEGELVAELGGLELRRLETARGKGAEMSTSQLLYRLAWEPIRAGDEAAPAAARGSWLVLGDPNGLGTEVTNRLRDAGATASHLTAPAGGRLSADALATGVQRAMPEGGRLAGVVDLRGADGGGGGGGGGEIPADTAVEELLSDATRLVQALASVRATTRLFFVTRGASAVRPGEAPAPEQAVLFGLVRSLAHEHPELAPLAVDLGDGTDAGGLVRLLLDPRDEQLVALRDGERFAGRLRRAPELLVTQAEDGRRLVRPGTSRYGLAPGGGTLDGLRLAPTGRIAPGPGQVEVEVRAAGLNFRDVMKAMDLYPGTAEELAALGDECAGVVTAVGPDVEGVAVGDEVIALAPRSLASHVTTLAELVVPKPAALDFAEGATLAVAAMTAQYGLHHLARIAPGERCLVHAAAGGVGLAAVQITLAAGAQVYATAGSDAKRDHLRGLGVHAVMDSRSLDFADEVLELTDGRGVDVVLNSLAGEALVRSLGVLRPFGRFVEIGKRDIYENARIGLRPFAANVAFFAVDLDQVLRDRPAFGRQLLLEVIDGLARGTLAKPAVTRFELAEAPSAFRHMAQARHIGKIALELGAAEVGADRRVRASGTYLVTGGLGALGIAVARRLVDEGARSLVLLGRSAPSEAAAEAIEDLRRAGADVSVEAIDVADEASLAALLARLRGEGRRLRGVLHAAGVLDDAFVVRSGDEQLRRVLRPKALGAANLDRLTREDELDFFVLFSSATAVLGSPGQAAYAAANAYLDALATRRRAQGLQGVSIQWGAWAEIGMAAAAESAGRSLVAAAGTIDPEEGLAALLSMLACETPVVAVLPTDWERWRELFPGFSASPLLREVAGAAAGADALPELRELIDRTPGEELPAVLRQHLMGELAHVLELSGDDLDVDTPLHDFGLDSLMALELKNRLEMTTGIEIPIVGLVEGPSLRELTAELGRLLGEARRAPREDRESVEALS